MTEHKPGEGVISEALNNNGIKSIPQDNELVDGNERSKRTAEEMAMNAALDDNKIKRVKTKCNDNRNESGDEAIQQQSVSAASSSQHGKEDLTNDQAAVSAAAVAPEASVPSTRVEPPASSPAIVEDISQSRGHMILSRGNPNEIQRWRAHRITEDYINLSAQMMLPGTHLAPFGYDAPTGQFPVDSITALSILTSPMRRPTVVEKWSPYEIAVFEGALSLVGKHFHKVQKFVKTKNTKEIIEFYYVWKKTAHYKLWKKQYVSPDDDVDTDDD